jgi:hypothetical protein
MTGLADGAFTRFYTPSSNQGAAVIGKLFPNTGGDVYLTTKLGPNYASGSGNRLIVWGSKTGANGTWTAIGNVAVTSTATNGAQQYVGYASTTYAYVSVGINTMMGGSVIFNDVMADCVYFIT